MNRATPTVMADLKSQLDPGHPIHTMICEHEMILGFLDQLKRCEAQIRLAAGFDPLAETMQTLRSVSSHLLGAEAHHRREEEVLFKEMEKRGLFGPPAVMREEHEIMRAGKKKIAELVGGVSAANFPEFRQRLSPAALGLESMLRLHIDKENHVLYPMALQAIPESDVWVRMKEDCDRIGYCCFTPKR